MGRKIGPQKFGSCTDNCRSPGSPMDTQAENSWGQLFYYTKSPIRGLFRVLAPSIFRLLDELVPRQRRNSLRRY